MISCFRVHGQSFSKRFGASTVPGTYARKRATSICADVPLPMRPLTEDQQRLVCAADEYGRMVQV